MSSSIVVLVQAIIIGFVNYGFLSYVYKEYKWREGHVDPMLKVCTTYKTPCTS